MTHRNSYAQKLLKTAVFTRTRASFYAQNAFTHRERFYTQMLVHAVAFTQTHTVGHTRKNFYKQMPFCIGLFYAQVL